MIQGTWIFLIRLILYIFKSNRCIFLIFLTCYINTYSWSVQVWGTTLTPPCILGFPDWPWFRILGVKKSQNWHHFTAQSSSLKLHRQWHTNLLLTVHSYILVTIIILWLWYNWVFKSCPGKWLCVNMIILSTTSYTWMFFPCHVELILWKVKDPLGYFLYCRIFYVEGSCVPRLSRVPRLKP